MLSSVLFLGGPYPSSLLNGKLRCMSSEWELAALTTVINQKNKEEK